MVIVGSQFQPLVFRLSSEQVYYRRYDLPEIEKILLSQKLVVDPNDISYLMAHLRKLSVDARKYLMWASCFGAT
jgi:hypothetical protein